MLYEPPIAYRREGLGTLQNSDHETQLARLLRGAGTTDEQLGLPRELRACTTAAEPAGPIVVPTLFLISEDTPSPRRRR